MNKVYTHYPGLISSIIVRLENLALFWNTSEKTQTFTSDLVGAVVPNNLTETKRFSYDSWISLSSTRNVKKRRWLPQVSNSVMHEKTDGKFNQWFLNTVCVAILCWWDSGQQHLAQFLKIDYITKGPQPDSDRNYNTVESFVQVHCILYQKIGRKRKDWWSRFLMSFNNVRILTVECGKMHKDVTKLLVVPVWQIPKPSGIIPRCTLWIFSLVGLS